MKHFKNLKFDTLEIIKLRDYSNVEDVVNNKVKNVEFTKTCTLEEEKKVVVWWNSFEDAQMARCHFPVYALKMFENKNLVGVATLCWNCDNINIWQKDKGSNFVCFDGNAKEAQALLSFCKERN